MSIFTHKPCKFGLWNNKYKGSKDKFMKKFLQRLAVFTAFLFATPFALYMVGSATSFAAFYLSRAMINTDACTSYYIGASKGTIWSHGEWHHYVDFKVVDSASLHQWEITDAPLPSSFWRRYSTSSIKRVVYRWPSNWWDPFSASDWKICLVSS